MTRSSGGGVLAIDPGEVHVGIALFKRGSGGRGAYCDYAIEVTPAEMILRLENDPYEKLIVEEFRLYPWKMAEQGFSQIKTAELIGVIRYIARKRHIEVVQQPASIKQACEGILRAKGVVLQSRGHGPHAKDAELHGFFFFRDNLKGVRWES